MSTTLPPAFSPTTEHPESECYQMPSGSHAEEKSARAVSPMAEQSAHCVLARSRSDCHQSRLSTRGEFRVGEFSDARAMRIYALARGKRKWHRPLSSAVVRRFFRGTASLYIFSILFSWKSHGLTAAAFSYLKQQLSCGCAAKTPFPLSPEISVRNFEVPGTAA